MKTFRYLLYMLLIVGGLTACNDDDVIVAPAPDASGTWTDERDGTEYTWVRYGRLEWLSQNFAYEPQEGNVLPNIVTAPNQYNDGINTKYFESFGRLYNYEAAMSAIPDGWRLPTREDWNYLESLTGGDIMGAVDLKLGGYYVNDEFFQQIHPNVDYYAYVYGFYWTSTVDEGKTGDGFAFYRKLTYNRPGSVSDSMDKNNYLSVRLVRDVK